MHGFALGEADALVLLREFNQRCLPPWSEGELIHKIKSAANAVHSFPRGYLMGDEMENGRTYPAQPIPPPPPKPKFQRDVLRRIAGKVPDIKDTVRFLSERSPVNVERQDSASVLRHLYARGSGEKILIFTEMKSQGQFLWEADHSDFIQQRHLPAGNDGVWFLPQPVSGGFFPNPRSDGNLSRRSEEAVLTFRYAVSGADPFRPAPDQDIRSSSWVYNTGGRSIALGPGFKMNPSEALLQRGFLDEAFCLG